MKTSHDRAPSRSPRTTALRESSPSPWASALRRSLWARTAALLLLLLLPASAERISWGSLPGQEHVNSTGQPLNSGFQFELGGFAGGFVPTPQNTSEWASHWIPVQRTRFNPRTRWFSSLVTVSPTSSPLQPGHPVYVWGFGGPESSGEWTLFRSDRWFWPKANPANPVPLQWFAKDATQVVLGSIRVIGGQLRLATAAVTDSLPPITTWTQWRSEELGHGHRTAPAEDIDQDGQANIVDFILGRDPSGAQAAEPTRWLLPSLRSRAGEQFLEVRVPRRRDRPVHWRIEVSDDCLTWRPALMDCEVVDEGSEAFVVRQTTPTSSPTCPRFLRVVPEPAP